MGSSISKYLTLILFWSIAHLGHSQNVFNKAFDESNTANHTANVLEYSTQFYFTQKSFINGDAVIQGLILDTNGLLVLKKPLVVNSNFNLYYGYAGALQYLSNNEFCQLYNVGLDSILQLVFFDDSLNVIKNTEYVFNNYVNAGVIKQINDSSLLVLGRVKVANDYNLVLINTDLQGNERWRTIFGESGKDDYGFAIEYVNNKILVSGNSTDLGAHLFEFDITGSLTFDTIYTNYDFGRNVKYHPNYGLYFLVDRKNVGVSQRFPVLLKLNTNYTIEWQKEYFTDVVYTYFQQLTISNQGTITFGGGTIANNLLTGLFFQVNQNGDSIGVKLIDHLANENSQFHDIRPTSDGGYILAGETDAPTQDSWIVKVNAWGCDNIPCVVGINEQPRNEDNELNCYPNPSNGWGTLKGSFENGHSANEIKIFNSLGQLVFSKTIVAKEFEMEVNLPSSGLYLVNLYQRDMVVKSLKWVVR